MRLHQMWDDFVTFVTGGFPHGPPARPDTNAINAQIDAAPVREHQVDPTAGTNGALAVPAQTPLVAQQEDVAPKSFVQRAQDRVFVATDALQVLRLQQEETNLRMQTHAMPAIPPGFKTSGTEF